jgi:hypothetical protein
MVAVERLTARQIAMQAFTDPPRPPQTSAASFNRLYRE